MIGEYDGWLLGPAPDTNFGGIKASTQHKTEIPYFCVLLTYCSSSNFATLLLSGWQNSHDAMCVHSHDTTSYRGWGYYAGPRDTRDPEEAFPHWKHDDPSLVLRCVPRSVSVDSRREPDPARAPLLRNLYRRTGRLMRGKITTNSNNTHEMYKTGPQLKVDVGGKKKNK